MKKEVELDVVEDFKIPAEFIYADISLSAVGLATLIQCQEDNINSVAEQNEISFDKAVTLLFARNYGKYAYKNAMNELIRAGLYEMENDGETDK